MTYRMPAEWHPHDACWMTWPCRADIWPHGLPVAWDAFVTVVLAIARFEPVMLVVPPAHTQAAAERLDGVQTAFPVTRINLPADDSWMRDTAPLFVIEGDRLQAVDFRFNAWGGKFRPWDADAALGMAVARQVRQQHPGMTLRQVDMVLEGGSVHVDGEGTLLTTEECLLNPNRNPTLTRTQIEAVLRQTLGVEVVIWLEKGVYGDTDTDGHVDNIATFVAPGVVLMQVCDEPDDPNFAITARNRLRLAQARDARGRPLKVVEVPQPQARSWQGERLAASYVNYYLANGGVVVPVFGDPQDAVALDIIQGCFADRQVVPVPGLDILLGGGNVHCITMQQPRVVS